jgi:hypothetical protein
MDYLLEIADRLLPSVLASATRGHGPILALETATTGSRRRKAAVKRERADPTVPRRHISPERILDREVWRMSSPVTPNPFPRFCAPSANPISAVVHRGCGQERGR